MDILAVAAFIIGGILGWGANHEPNKPAPVEPILWGAKQHQDGMMMCRTMCDKKVLSYDPMTGECECK